MEQKTYKELEKEINDLKLKEHTKKYIHIPKPNLLPLLGIIVFGFLSWANLKLFNWEFLKVIFGDNEVVSNYSFHFSQLINVFPIIAEYVFIALTIISLVALIKGGYKNLKTFKEDGLIFGLIFGLIGGLITGLIFGLIGGLIIGLIIGLIGGLITGLIGGLITGLIFGLIGEFI